MCGICGIVVAPGSARAATRDLVVRMCDSIRHRGPDGEGLFLDPGVALGHRRLSIVDVAHGAQPMASADGRYQLVYNGEVYNHPTLMPQLQADGVQYRTHCDTETVLHLYERVGKALPSELRGMFAIAIWDRTGARTLPRPRPLRRSSRSTTRTSTTARSSSARRSRRFSRRGRSAPNSMPAPLPDLLANYAPSGDETLYAGIRRLPAGHTLTWKDGAITIAPYWDLTFAEGTLDDRSESSLVEEYHERFREAVKIRLMADVPLGMFLSGGIDSAAITAVMSQLVDEPIKTFSVAFAEREANELAYARMVVRTL